MTCPRCGSGDLDTTAWCSCCGTQLSVKEERMLRAQMPLPARAVSIEEYSPTAIDEES